MIAFLAAGCGSENSAPDSTLGEDTRDNTIDAKTLEETAEKKVLAGWYMRTIAKATLADGSKYVHQTAGVFGELDESSDEKDKHDIASFKDAILQVVFLPEWDKDGESYFSDYRSYGDAQKQVWTFQVKNQRDVNLASADLNLSIAGLYDVYKVNDTRYEEELASNNSKKTSLNLVDVDNSTSYTLEQLTTASLSMDGEHTRTFRWVLGTVEESDYAPSVSSAPQRSAARTTTSDFKEAPQTNGTFGLPPQ